MVAMLRLGVCPGLCDEPAVGKSHQILEHSARASTPVTIHHVFLDGKLDGCHPRF